MMSQSPLAHPPRIASWLLELVAPAEHAEAILGDLLEEFSQFASRSGLASARRWYWRQSAKTLAHLLGTGFRTASWSIVGIVLGGYLLLAFGASRSWVEDAIVGVIQFRRHHVTPHYSNLEAYVFWLNISILVGHLLVSLLIGCLVGAAAKGREMVATITLASVWTTIIAKGILVLAIRHWPEQASVLPFWVDQLGSSGLVVMGGVIIREIRLAISRRSSRV